MDIMTELEEQIQGWRREQELIEDMIQEAHDRIDNLHNSELKLKVS